MDKRTEQRFQKLEQRLIALERSMVKILMIESSLNEKGSFDKEKFEQLRRELNEKL